MNAPRNHIVADMSAHLSADLKQVLLRHTKAFQAGGVSTIEGQAIFLMAATIFAVEACGAAVALMNVSSDDDIGHRYDKVLASMSEGIQRMRADTIADLSAAIAIVRSRRA